MEDFREKTDDVRSKSKPWPKEGSSGFHVDICVYMNLPEGKDQPKTIEGIGGRSRARTADLLLVRQAL